MKYEIFACGVGGQGILSITNILCSAGVESGIPIRGSETHGMSQRFGTVVATVRIGDVHSSLIAERTADVIVGMEPVETLRYAKYVKPGGYIIMNTESVPSPASIILKMKYPEIDEITKSLSDYTDIKNILGFNATKIATELGSALVQNMVLLGALQKLPGFPISQEILLRSMEKQLNKKFHALNTQAFNKGQKVVENLLPVK